MSNLIEAMARAIGMHFLWGDAVPGDVTCGDFADRSRRSATAALTALEQAGWRVVPKEATAEMKARGHDYGWSGVIEGCHELEAERAGQLYVDMISAAPKVTGP